MLDVNVLLTMCVGLASAGLVQLAKYVKSIPISETQRGRIRFAAAALSFVGVLVTRYLNGTIDDEQFLGLVAESALGYFFSYLGYQSLLKPKEKPSEENQ